MKKKKPSGFFVSLRIIVHKCRFSYVMLKQHDDSPDPAETDKNIENDRNDRSGSEDPCNEIEIEKTDKQPVQCTDDHKDQGNDIHEITPFTPLVCAVSKDFMLLLFGKDFNFKSIEGDGFHKVVLFENRVGELIELTNMLVENDRTCKIKRLAQIMQDRHPAR